MTSRPEAERISQLIFFGTVVLVGWLAWRIVEPFLAEIGWAVVLAICLDPVRVRLQPRLGPTKTAIVLTLGVLLLIVLPVVFVGIAMVNEGGPAVGYVEAQLRNEGGPAGFFHKGWEWLRARAPFLPGEQEVIARITASIGGVAQYLAGQAGNLLASAAGFLFALGITLAVLFFLLRDAASFSRGVRRVLPFGPEQNAALMEIAASLVSASVTATLAIAAIQGVIGGITFALLGVQGAVLWGVILGIMALLPLLGATLVWAPGAILLALSGSLVKGIVLAAVGLLILGNVDNVVRPLLLSGKSQMNTLVLIISLMGGVSAFGFIGIVLGPLVAALLSALVESYHAAPEPAPEAAGMPAAVPAPLEPAPDEAIRPAS